MSDSAAAATVGAVAAAAVAAELQPRSSVVALAAAAGGLAGFLLWRTCDRTPKCTSNPVINEALKQIDAVHRQQPKRPEDALDELTYCQEVETWVLRLQGGPSLVSPALRIAARAQHFERQVLPRTKYPDGREGYLKWRSTVKRRQGDRLTEVLRKAGVDLATVDRAARLVAKELPLKDDFEMQALEDAACLVFLNSELESFKKGKDDQKLVDIFCKTWKKMSLKAQIHAVGLDYEPRMLGCLVEAIAVAEKLEATTTPMVAPRLPAATIALLRESWARVHQETFGTEFYERLYTEDESLRADFDYPVARPANVFKVVQVLVDLLDTELVPRQERIVHAVAALGHHFGKLRTAHMAPIKRALVRTVTTYAPAKEKKATNRAWEAFFYAVAAVAAPCLVGTDRLEEFAAATAASLPTPGGGPHAAAVAAHGVALLEMSLNISALGASAEKPPEEVLHKLREARAWLVTLVKDDVNAYCGLLASVYARSDAGSEEAASSSAEEAEKRRWLRRATEVPMRVAELSMGSAITCLACRKHVKKSLQGDWIAGAKLLRTASEISLKNVSINLRDMAAKGSGDVEKRMAKIRDTEPPWEDLCDV